MAEESALELTVAIRPVDPAEGPRVKEIAIASKGFWGYEAERVRRWADGGDFSAERLRELIAFVAEAGPRPIAWYSLDPGGETCWLGDLWVEPDWIGKGIGAALFRHAADHARGLGATLLEWEAEPNALGFYEKMGAKHLRQGDPSAWGRRNSIMGVELGG
jgi:GNAT superfamily N-acetyltransferase